jgi:hypothetical protein
MIACVKKVGAHLRGDRWPAMPVTHMHVDGIRSPSANGALGQLALPQTKGYRS